MNSALGKSRTAYLLLKGGREGGGGRWGQRREQGGEIIHRIQEFRRVERFCTSAQTVWLESRQDTHVVAERDKPTSLGTSGGYDVTDGLTVCVQQAEREKCTFVCLFLSLEFGSVHGLKYVPTAGPYIGKSNNFALIIVRQWYLKEFDESSECAHVSTLVKSGRGSSLPTPSRH